MTWRTPRAAAATPAARPRTLRWAVAGAALGAAVAAVAFAPASWLANGVARASGGQLLLADARGTVWSGDAVPVLSGGAGSRDAAALPGRLHWSLGWAGRALEVRATQDCCLAGTLVVRVEPGWGRLRIELPPAEGARGQWPAAWLGGLGTPWNLLQLGGVLRVSSPGLVVESVQGRWRFDGRAELAIDGASSRLVALPRLGSYRLVVQGDAASGDAVLQLATSEGPLRLAGQGQWGGGRLRFRGDARADAGAEAALGNLLNIIGRRQGALSVISIG